MRMQYDYSPKQLWVSLFTSQQTEARQEQRGEDLPTRRKRKEKKWETENKNRKEKGKKK